MKGRTLFTRKNDNRIQSNGLNRLTNTETEGRSSTSGENFVFELENKSQIHIETNANIITIPKVPQFKKILYGSLF